ncbi:MAG: polysaccharide biosynthesis tyrosine autokinase [Acidimicrobiales bacterium]
MGSDHGDPTTGSLGCERLEGRLVFTLIAARETPVDDYELSIQDYMRVLRRGWHLLVAAIVVCAGLGYGLTTLQADRYRSTADVLVGVQQAANVVDAGDGQIGQADRLETEVAFIESSVMRSAVRETEGSAPGVDAQVDGEASVIEIRVSDGDPEVAARFANAYAETYIEERRQRAVDDYLATAAVVQARIDDIDVLLESLDADDPEAAALNSQRLVYLNAIESLALGADLSGGITAQVISPAGVPAGPYSPKPVRNGILGGIIGVAIGLALVLLRETLDDRIRSKEDLEKASGLPTLAVIPHVADWKRDDDERLVSLDEPSSDTAEAYRTLRTAMQFFSLDRSIRTIQVTSANPGEGKSTTVVNLAVAMARAGRRVIILDGDLRNPRIHRFLGLRRRPGFTDVLLGEATPRSTAVPSPKAANLSLLAIGAGRPTTNPSEALGGRTTRELLMMLGEAADVVLVDSPPVLPVSDALVLAGQVDAVLVVAKANRARKKELVRAVELLAQVNAPVIGTVLNDAPRGGTYGYGAYGYGYPVREQGSMKKRRNGDDNLWDDQSDDDGDTLEHDLEALFSRRAGVEDT